MKLRRRERRRPENHEGGNRKNPFAQTTAHLGPRLRDSLRDTRPYPETVEGPSEDRPSPVPAAAAAAEIRLADPVAKKIFLFARWMIFRKL